MSGKSRGYEEILADLKEKGSLPALEGDMHEDSDSSDEETKKKSRTKTSMKLGKKKPKAPKPKRGSLGWAHSGDKAEAEDDDGVMRPPPMFQEVVWNEYCVLFPDGSHTPFNDEVRYTNLNGYLRKRLAVKDGGNPGKSAGGKADYAIQYGAARRGWHRHYIYVNLKWLAWFEEDPEGPKPGPGKSAKMAVSRGKGLGSVHLDSQECTLYVHREYPNEFAIKYECYDDKHGKYDQLLMMQAQTPEDAHAWVVAIASCLYFCSQSFAELIEDCQRFFNAVPKSYEDGRLSVIEALDLLRAMGREATLEQVEQCADLAQVEKRFDAREFAFLVRFVCSDVEPAGELLRAFETFDPQGYNIVSADSLVTHLVQCGVPPEEIEPIVRAAGPTPNGNIHYVNLVRALYPMSLADIDEHALKAASNRVSGATPGLGSARASSVTDGRKTSVDRPSARLRESRRLQADPRLSDPSISAAERASQRRASALMAEQSRRASLERETKLREQERYDLQTHRDSLQLQRQASSDDNISDGPITAAARAQLAAAGYDAYGTRADGYDDAYGSKADGYDGGYGYDAYGGGGVAQCAACCSAAGVPTDPTPRTAVISADLDAQGAAAGPTPRTYAGRLERAAAGAAAPEAEPPSMLTSVGSSITGGLQGAASWVGSFFGGGAAAPTAAQPEGGEADPYSDTPGKRPLNPGMGAEPESSASYNLMTAGQCHRI
eukprot:Transcript_6617.p1 GENE.Transcript_6617~~Transcript_6617.p1  ORF type:complete len:753 (-),score=278.29 Transcript_6617:199-2352(-)